ncbi:hypothetical protein CA265_10310 [Sphingobacteriaceae bacterium GW460-11-11-14-LB5]|nr:hypothetical protein CA265_10310 [Sphingobacteriaceae bacterium GW460-11-11-14-LB5]
MLLAGVISYSKLKKRHKFTSKAILLFENDRAVIPGQYSPAIQLAPIEEIGGYRFCQVYNRMACSRYVAKSTQALLINQMTVSRH